MDSRLQEGFDVTERQRAALRSSVSTLSDAQLNWKPQPGVWSVLQIVEHLVLSSETIGSAQETAAMQKEALMFRILPRSWRRAMVLRALDSNVALPLPSPALEPTGNAALPELLSRWNAAGDAMRRTLETLAWDEPRYSHPVLGPLTAGQMQALGRTHTAYHTRQIEALQRNPAFPAPEAPGGSRP